MDPLRPDDFSAQAILAGAPGRGADEPRPHPGPLSGPRPAPPQGLMPLHARRALTPEEITLGASIFAAEIDWPRVRLVQAPPLPFGAMAPFRHTIIFARWRAPTDFAAAPLAEQGWLIHELAHVWQAARGYVLPIAKLGALGRRAYRLGAAPRSRFHAHNIEQQAEIARFVFLARAGLETPWPREVLEAVWADRL